MADWDWLKEFGERRNPSFSLRDPEVTSAARTIAFNTAALHTQDAATGCFTFWTTRRKIEYVSLTSNRLEDALEVLQTSFFPYENVCKAIGFSKIPEAFGEMDDMIIKTAKQGVSVIAIDRETGKIAGTLINKIQDKNTSSKEYYENYIKNAKYPEIKGLFQFLIDMEDSIDPFTPYDADCLMELLFLGVSPDYSKRGIGYMLCQVAMQLATSLYKGENIKISLDNTELPLDPRPQVVTAVFTTFITQKIGKKLNFDILKTMHCKDLYYNGRSYASVLGNTTEAFTVECKRLEK